MPKRTSTKIPAQRPTDVNQVASFLVRQTTEDKPFEAYQPSEAPKIVPKAVSRVMAQMGSRGGKIGGKRRLVTMTAEQRSQVASDAAKARWAKKVVN
jgi:hypothetical protein